MKDKVNKIVLCIVVILSIFVMSSVFYSLLNFIKNTNLRTLIANLMYLIILIIIYRKEIIYGLKDLKKNFKKVLDISIKYWLLGIVIMIASNLFINLIIFNGDIASNEELVRETMLGNPVFGIISACLIAPILEEIIFRASLKRIIKKKYVYAVLSGLIFGLLHAITDINSIIDLIYIIPYGALGYSFAIMYEETNNIFSSIMMHMLHNTISTILIFSVLG